MISLSVSLSFVFDIGWVLVVILLPLLRQLAYFATSNTCPQSEPLIASFQGEISNVTFSYILSAACILSHRETHTKKFWALYDHFSQELHFNNHDPLQKNIRIFQKLFHHQTQTPVSIASKLNL